MAVIVYYAMVMENSQVKAACKCKLCQVHKFKLNDAIGQHKRYLTCCCRQHWHCHQREMASESSTTDGSQICRYHKAVSI